MRFIPDLRMSLISISTLDSNGYSFRSKGGVLKVTKSVMVMMKGQKLSGNIYRLLGNTVVSGVANVESDYNNTVLWHMRLGHMSEWGMMELHKRKLLKGIKSCKLDFCKIYVLGKQHRVKFKTGLHRIKGLLDYIHSDVWGLMRDVSRAGYM